MTTKEVIAALERGALANRQDPFRVGNLIHLSAPGEVVMTGDLHGHVQNFERLCRYAQLDRHPDRHLILHELLHGGGAAAPDQCESFLLLARAAQLKADFPRQAHFLLSNHEIAQATRSEILKSGQPMVRAVSNAISTTFADKTALVVQALDEFIRSMPLAIRTGNRIWLSHSLPSERHVQHFETPEVFDRQLTIEDLRTNPAVRALTWDRVHSQAGLDELRRRWHVDVFVVGHKPQTEGAAAEYDCLIVLASDHPHGCFLPFRLDEHYDRDALYRLIQPVASIT